MLPTLIQEPPSGDKWLHEVKHDGFRTQLLRSSGAGAFTRNGLDWSERYRFILTDLSKLFCSTAILDGEVIIQDEQGRADFDNLGFAIHRHPERLTFYAFDLLYLDGEDLRKEPLLDRRLRLQELVGEHDPGCRIQYSQHIIGSGPEFFDVVCGAELEGIVSKKLTSRYISGRSKSWLKSKAFIEGEFVAIGHKRDKDRYLVLLAREKDGALEYAGAGWVALSDKDRERFWRAMERLETDKPAAPAGVRKASWVKPKIRVRVQHLRCARMLRHATIKGIIDT